MGSGGTQVGDSVYYTYSNIDYRLRNDHAGRAFALLSTYGPAAPTRFGYSRNQVLVYIGNSGNDSDTCSGRYLTTSDRIELSRTCVFGNYGTFTVMHEYGHAYHYAALEPWRTYSCPNGSHSVEQSTNLQCAFVEGFADFFSVWVLQNRLPPSNSDYSNYLFEQNPYRTYGDGSMIEGAVAGLLLDMVDGSSDIDGISGDDDSLTWPGSYVSALIRTCSPGGQARIDGIDEFIYCAEQDVNARTANPYNSWRAYSSVTEGATEPTGWSAAVVRSFWLYNLYNSGVNP